MSSSVSTEIYSLWLQQARQKDPNMPSTSPAIGVTPAMISQAESIAEDRPVPVSYTHLTLPTIYSV